jgi:hypothetical protein
MSADPDSRTERDAVHRLIVEVASGARRLTAAEMDRVLRRVAAAGFDPHARETARGMLAGIEWRGRTLRGADRLPPMERHYLRHVLRVPEWPIGTTPDEYVASIQAVILDGTSGVYTSLYRDAPQLGVIRRSGALRGPEGTDWVLVEYRLETGHWTTAYQPLRGLLDLKGPERGALRWLRRARLRAE